MKKSIFIIREGEVEAFIPGNRREREFLLTPALQKPNVLGTERMHLASLPQMHR